ncbi:MAG: PLP-dependent aspartate aminotransferase family protein [Pseudomonadota bacterium]
MKNFRPYDIETIAVHGGETPDPHSGASAPNLVMSSTFVVNQDSGFSAHNLDDDSPYLYSRWGNPTVSQLEAKLALLEKGEACACFASGMAAAASVFFTELGHGDHLLLSDVSYAGIAELARTTLPRMGVQVSTVDMSDLEEVKAAVKDNTKLIWIETPVNPILRLTDIRGICDIAKQNNAKVGVDSTFSSPIGTQPLTLGVDYVMHSLTKYIGGHGDALGGAVIASRTNIDRLRLEAVVHYGGILSPFNAWLILRGAATLPIRMRAHQDNAIAVASYLQNHHEVLRVNYPGLESHPQHALAKQQMQNFSGMLSFRVKNPDQARHKMLSSMDFIHYAVSLGHHRSLVFWLGTDDLMESSFKLTGRSLEKYRDYAGDGIFRLSVGLESPKDIINDLSKVL